MALLNENKTISLKDGRVLVYAEYGDLKGTPVLYFHGWPGSRLNGIETDEAAKHIGVRVISIDRPGFGISDYKKNRSLLDWADDIKEVLNYLNIKNCSVMGVSRGAPYALICTYKIPQYINKTGIVVGLAPLNIKGNLEGMMLQARLSFLIYHKFLISRDIASIINLIAFRYLTKLSNSRILGSEEDKKLLKEKFSNIDMSALSSEPFKQGVKSPAQDLRIFVNDWGFKLNEITSKVYLWYGAKDKNVPLNMGRYYHSQIKNSELFIDKEGGHLFRNNIEEEILRTLTQ